MRPDVLTNHHLIPKSRGGFFGSDNIRRLPWRNHSAWHDLYRERIPEEVIRVMIQDFESFHAPRWVAFVRSASLEIVYHYPQLRVMTDKRRAAWQLLFGRQEPLRVITTWLNEWVPHGYFHEFHFGCITGTATIIGPSRKIDPVPHASLVGIIAKRAGASSASRRRKHRFFQTRRRAGKSGRPQEIPNLDEQLAEWEESRLDEQRRW